MSSDPVARPLPLLRAMVDALDHELLQLAARRMAVVSEIASYKRQHHLRIRDPQREREILEDRARRAEEMGLPKGEIEALFRVLLRASRDHQASLRTELPYETPSLTVAVVGGRGAMGALIARMFGDLGHSVLVTDHETELSPGDAAEVADVIVISVPIDVTEQVIREVGPRLRPESLLMDVTSVKSEPVRAMLESTKANVVGTHPMFGPSVHSLQGQRVVVCRSRGDHWANWVSAMFTARGLAVVETTPEHHDRMMATVQVLTHFQTQVHGLTLATARRTIGRVAAVHLACLPDGAVHGCAAFRAVGGSLRPDRNEEPGHSRCDSDLSHCCAGSAEILASGDRDRFRAMFQRSPGIPRPVHWRGARTNELPHRPARGTNMMPAGCVNSGGDEELVPRSTRVAYHSPPRRMVHDAHNFARASRPHSPGSLCFAARQSSRRNGGGDRPVWPEEGPMKWPPRPTTSEITANDLGRDCTSSLTIPCMGVASANRAT